MIIIADNDAAQRERLRALLDRHGLMALAVPLDGGLGGTIAAHRPAVIAAGVVLDRESDEVALIQVLRKQGALDGARLVLLAATAPARNPALVKKGRLEIACDAYLDKPVDAVEFIRTVRALVPAAGAPPLVSSAVGS
ncbi:MAG: hypothetical protein ABIF71_06185 [Planctomycetota bacterium]